MTQQPKEKYLVTRLDIDIEPKETLYFVGTEEKSICSCEEISDALMIANSLNANSRPHPAPAVNRNKDGKLTLTYDEYSLAEHDAAIARQAREDVLKEPRDCATCNNNHNAINYVREMQSCTRRIVNKRRMDDLKECCPNCRSMGKFTFNENKCRGYHGHCEQCSCNRFNWWHAKCNCRIIEEYDEQQKGGKRNELPKAC